MSSCFGVRKSSDDREPLLPRYRDDTTLQRELHQKLHSYQMWRALIKGYMPSTEQLVINLRTLMAADILNPDNPELSDSGRLVVRHTRKLLEQFTTLLQHKNGQDQIQDFIWFLSKSEISVDVDDIRNRAKQAKGKADSIAGIAALGTQDGHVTNVVQHTKAFEPLALSCSPTQTSVSSSQISIPSAGKYSRTPPSLCHMPQRKLGRSLSLPSRSKRQLRTRRRTAERRSASKTSRMELPKWLRSLATKC